MVEATPAGVGHRGTADVQSNRAIQAGPISLEYARTLQSPLFSFASWIVICVLSFSYFLFDLRFNRKDASGGGLQTIQLQGTAAEDKLPAESFFDQLINVVDVLQDIDLMAQQLIVHREGTVTGLIGLEIDRHHGDALLYDPLSRVHPQVGRDCKIIFLAPVGIGIAGGDQQRLALTVSPP